MVPLTCVAHLAVLSLAVSAGARYHSGPQTMTTPPGPQALRYIARWLPPSILVRRPQLSPGPSAVRLL